MGTSSRVEELKQKFDENPRRYFAPLANELRKLGDLAQAISICRSHLPGQPGHVSGHIVLAQALHEAGELEESRAAFAAAVELDPENLIALRYMGDIARATGDRAGARQWYQRVLDADPRNYDISRIVRELDSEPNEQPPEAPEVAANVPSLEEGAPQHEEPAPPPVASWHRKEPESASAHAAADGDDSSQRRVKRVVPAPEQVTMDTSVEAREQTSDHSASDTPFDMPAMGSFPHVDATEAAAPASEHEPHGRHAAEDDLGFSAEASFSIELPAPHGPVNGAPEHRHESALPDAGDELPIDPSELGQPWEQKPTPASALSDYEAAPEQWFDAVAAAGAQESADAGEAEREGYRRSPTVEIEALFVGEANEPAEKAAESSAQVENPPSTPTVTAAQEPDAVEEAFSEPPAARSRESWSEKPSLMALPNLEEPDPMVGRTPAFTDAVPEPATPFITETLAELYLQQGFRDEALSIYRQLLIRNPSDDTLRNRIANLEGGSEVETPPATAAARPIGNERAAQSVRTFFGRLARRQPRQSSHRGGFPPKGGDRPLTEPEPRSSLFSAPAAESDTRAARNLASAFSRDPAASGPSPTAPGDRSLDHLFREAPPPDAGPVTLDEFYSPPGAASAERHSEPAPDDERAKDIRQFTSWLEGLKKK